MPLGTELSLGPGHIVLDGDPAPPQNGDTAAPTFQPMFIMAKRSPISATAELLLRPLKNHSTPGINTPCRDIHDGDNSLHCGDHWRRPSNARNCRFSHLLSWKKNFYMNFLTIHRVKLRHSNGGQVVTLRSLCCAATWRTRPMRS